MLLWGRLFAAATPYSFADLLLSKNQDIVQKKDLTLTIAVNAPQITAQEHFARMDAFFDPNNPNNTTPESEEPFTPTTEMLLSLFYGPVTPIPSPVALLPALDSPPALGLPFSPDSPPSTPANDRYPFTPDDTHLDTHLPIGMNPFASPGTPTPSFVRAGWDNRRLFLPLPEYDTDTELKQLVSSSPDIPMSELPNPNSHGSPDRLSPATRLLFLASHHLSLTCLTTRPLSAIQTDILAGSGDFGSPSPSSPASDAEPVLPFIPRLSSPFPFVPRLTSPVSDMPDEEIVLGYPESDSDSEMDEAISTLLRPSSPASDAALPFIPSPLITFPIVLGYPESDSDSEMDQLSDSSPVQAISALPRQNSPASAAQLILTFIPTVPIPHPALPWSEMDSDDLEPGYSESEPHESDAEMDGSESDSPVSQTETQNISRLAAPHGVSAASDEEVEEMSVENLSRSSTPLSDLFRSDDNAARASSPASSTSWGFSERKPAGSPAPSPSADAAPSPASDSRSPRRIMTYAFAARRILRQRRIDIEEAREISHQLQKNSKIYAAPTKLAKRKPERRSRRHRRGRLGDMSNFGVSEAGRSAYDPCELHAKPLPIVDCHSTMMGVVSPPPRGNEMLWSDVLFELDKGMTIIYGIENFQHLGERQSVLPFALTYGVPLDKPYLIEHNPDTARVLTSLFRSGGIQLVSKFHNHLYQRIAPRSFADALEKVQHLSARGIATSQFSDSVFTSAAFCFGDAPSAPETNDDAAIDTMEAFTVLGKFDAGHLELQDEEKIIKLRAGTTVLLAAGSKPYKFSAVGKTEHLYVFRQWCSAGILRWIEKGGRSDTEFQKGASFEDRLSWINRSHDRGVTGIKLFSPLHDLYTF
ncbi:hypothetical protein R3P38DRAFT_3218884 [Favolaschia claudopus]|uniref:Uncharacterized protein n=1 Tax=Favolaschia claudopus TaxID=2862362 RepID=A0AAW0A3Q1_9AGAR